MVNIREIDSSTISMMIDNKVTPVENCPVLHTTCDTPLGKELKTMIISLNNPDSIDQLDYIINQLKSNWYIN